MGIKTYLLQVLQVRYKVNFLVGYIQLVPDPPSMFTNCCTRNVQSLGNLFGGRPSPDQVAYFDLPGG